MNIYLWGSLIIGISGIYLKKELHIMLYILSYKLHIKGKYIEMYENLINQFKMYANGIRILSMGYLPISLLPQAKLKELLNKVRKTIQITNSYYDIIIKKLYLYYDMKLAKFSINKQRNLIVQFPIFIQPYIQQQLILYQIEMIPISIKDLNKKAHSYTHLQVDRLYIALNSETYI